ncbi:MAG: sugar ABC transporter permease, partial [Anaerolineae bacterium]|nr:sugar ABC transporter permease [Anaerolineae bacterium]
MRQQDRRTAWLLVLPALVVILGVTLWPIIYTFILSFFQAPTGINQVRTFVGFGNYLEMVKDPTFWETI